MDSSLVPLIIIGILMTIIGICLYSAIQYMRDHIQSIVTPTDEPDIPNTQESSLGRGQWCFVGEDMTGRWCVKVPEEGLCPTKRVFVSRTECERKTASASPLGITQDRSTTMIPLSGISLV